MRFWGPKANIQHEYGENNRGRYDEHGEKKILDDEREMVRIGRDLGRDKQQEDGHGQ